MAKLPTVEQMKFRKYPPLRSGPPILWPTKRYFRRNEGTTDYATIPEVTLAGDFVIECDFTFDENSNSKLLGHTSVSAAGLFGVDMDGNIVVRHSGTWASLGVVPNLITGVLYKAVLSRVGGVISASVGGVNAPSNTSYSGNWIISQLSRAFGSGGYEYLAGILANLKIYDNGELIHNWKINSNANTEADLVSGATMTFINGNADDWGLFDRQADGDWKGNGLIVPPWDSVDQILVIA